MMTRQLLKPILSIIFFFTALALHSQVPEGGIFLNSQSGTLYNKIGKCTVKEVPVDGQEFSIALEVIVGTGIANSWDAQLKFPAIAGVETDDVVLVAFYARTTESAEETGEGFLNVIIEHNVTYAKEISHTMSIGNEWREYYAPAQMGVTLLQSEVSYLFHMGFENQTVEVASVRFINYKDTRTLEEMPFTETSYVGREPDASWRAPAAERIGQIRKGKMKVTVLDEAGIPVEDAEIEIEMVQHQFGFGTAVVSSRITSNATYRNHLFEMFNEVVFENDLKWPQFENISTHSTISKALDTLDSHHVPARGHNIIWPAYNRMPDFVEGLAGNPEMMRQAIDAHFDDVVSFTNGRLNDWDVMNEPYTEHDVQDVLGDEVMADWFKRPRRIDRGVKLYINEYSIVSAGGKNKIKQDYYYNLIREIDSLGGKIEGIGMQGHFSGELTPINKVYEILERFAELEKEIKITEHDINMGEREWEVQADYTRDFLTICFSHPSVKSVLAWGFWANAHWRPDAAYFDSEWNLRPHGEMWMDLTKNQWWTPAMDTVSDENGKFAFEGFLGTYSYTVMVGDSMRTGTFTLDHSNQSGITDSIVISMDNAIPEVVEIIPSTLGFICENEEVTLSAQEGEGLMYSWTLNGEDLPDESSSIVAGDSGSYVVTVSKGAINMTSEPYLLVVMPLPENPVLTDEDFAICMGESVIIESNGGAGLEYEWMSNENLVQWGGTSLETDVAGRYSLKVTENGCSAESNTVAVAQLSAGDPSCITGIETGESGSNIFPNPCHGSVQVELGSVDSKGGTIELYDSTGKLNYSGQIEMGSTAFTVPVTGTGLHMLRIIQGESIQTHRIIAE